MLQELAANIYDAGGVVGAYVRMIVFVVCVCVCVMCFVSFVCLHMILCHRATQACMYVCVMMCVCDGVYVMMCVCVCDVCV